MGYEGFLWFAAKPRSNRPVGELASEGDCASNSFKPPAVLYSLSD